MTERRPSIVRPRNVVLGILLLLAAGVAWFVVAASTAAPGTSRDFFAELQTLVRDQQPGDVAENGWPRLQSAIEAWTRLEAEMLQGGGADERLQPAEVGKSWDLDWSQIALPEGDPELVAYAELMVRESAARGILDDLAAAADAPIQRIDYQRAEPNHSITLPELRSLRDLAKLECARMALAVRDGDERTLLRATRNLAAFVRHCTRQATLIEHLVGHSIIGLTAAALEGILATHELDASTLAELARIVDDEMTVGSYRVALQGERLSIGNVVQWTHSDDGDGDGQLLLTRLGELTSDWGTTGDLSTFGRDAPGIVNVLGIFFPSKKQTMAKADAFFDMLEDAVDATPERRAELLGEADVLIQQTPRRYVVLRLALPAVGRSIEWSRTSLARREALRLAIAAERFELATGAPPATAGDLVPRFLDAVPISPATGEALEYGAPEEEPPPAD